MIKDSGNRRKFSTGAVRDIQTGKGRCDLMPLDVVAHYMDDKVIKYISMFKESNYTDTNPLFYALYEFSINSYVNDATMILEVSKHFEEGALKYGENNWQKGLPVNCYIDSAVRHYLKCASGHKDEQHDRAFVWNILCCIWTVKHKGGEEYET